ncbi:MAG: nuclear transport factor 2 family protein [Bacteroidota bacterium]|nr:nuclear transport factor 2 family protein [Bacteroidota bacterium]
MKKIITLILCMFFVNLNSQQWLDDSCNKKASKIVNEAVEHLANLEQLTAVGMAKAALMLDEDCGCANLVMAATAARNGSRKSKLEAIDVSSLNSEEKVWHKVLTATLTGDSETYMASLKSGLEETPNSPLLNWLNSAGDYNNYKKFSTDFPEHASAAYNMVAYGYANGEIGGKVDYEAAMDALDKSRELHDGPNALDSRAEIYAMSGDYLKARQNQFGAYDYAWFASPYTPKLVTYNRKVNKDEIVKNLKEAQVNLQNAILERDKEEYEKYVTADMQLVTGDSNLQEFYEFTDESLTRETNVNWNSFDLRDIEIDFSPDMTMAVLTFYADGSYTQGDSEDVVDYSTRASAVWIATDDGWKSVHANWAPYGGGSGIPKN